VETGLVRASDAATDHYQQHVENALDVIHRSY
jgi:hypothetical protein